jgi:hypothetical protein
MRSPLDELLELYRAHSTGAIEASDGRLLLDTFGAAQPEDLLAIAGYREAFGLVSMCSRFVDGIVSKHSRTDEQVRESIRMLRRMHDDDEPAGKINATRKLVEGRLYPNWPAADRMLYDEKKQILEWQDFFVSYTNRDAPVTNEQFRSLIKSCLGSMPKGEQAGVNQLARVITRHLRRYQGLRGFFDESDIKAGENIEDAVDRFCTKAFALVQLIEPLTFDKEPPRNWCFHEYTRFSENHEVVALMGDRNRHYFIITDPDLGAIRPAALSPPYSAWFQRMNDLRQTHIVLTNERNTTLRSKIKVIANEILKLRAEVIDRWLS